MRAISYTAARANLANTMKRVCEDHEPVIITRKNNETVIMMSLDDYGSLTETAYLLRSPRNSKRLAESMEEFQSGRGRERELIE